ncbi:hypothetical protein N9W79_02250, partial [bacterium]|nr:hypothetical protein [bacterium]
MNQKTRSEYSICYNKFLEKVKKKKKKAIAEGTVSFVYKIAENGELEDFEVSGNTIGNEFLSNCISKQFAGLWFSPPPLGISRYQSYDFNFTLPRGGNATPPANK